MIDLHTHTTASDGQYPPADLVALARRAGLAGIAVTDHDTVEGLADALEAGSRLGVRLIPGIELSTFVRGREAHILGHFVDPREPRLEGLSKLLREHREKRMGRMIERLEQLGIEVAFEEVVAASGGDNLGRPHLALVLIAHGHAADVKQAFDRYIGVGRPAYVERYKLTSREAIELIHGAGGCATLAHAFASGLGEAEIRELKDDGLAGLEVVHPDHSPGQRQQVAALARALDLVPTGGSDFHGERIVPARKLGLIGTGEREVELLQERAARDRRGR